MLQGRSGKYFWYCYILLLIAFSIARMVERIYSESGGFSSRYTPLFVALVVSLGIYGSVNNKPFFARWFWQCLYITIGVAIAVAVMTSVYLLLFVGLSTLPAVTLLLIVSTFVFPALLNLRSYTKKTTGNWR
ncbi:hypothetical protein [Aestuariibacter sp. A3R04]|uniref:hypothetical protein n=1 Tax=Aestuariibacter sp. A3R04 TaxID=2841571 RepID=UPI001C098A96|nr:hypothetical protein [Aestuariibacter sp. A3R04]MBU3023964.1 hypothetical protein [Aestuariibacter sp. A3R04]